MGADQADDFEKAILISFAQDGQVEESLKVILLATIVHPSCPGHSQLEGPCLWTVQSYPLASAMFCPRDRRIEKPVCQQRRAAAYCDEVKKSPDCLELCLTRFATSLYNEVRFWCLQTLHEVSLPFALPFTNARDN